MESESSLSASSSEQQAPRKSVSVEGIRYARRRERPAFFARAGEWIYDVRFPDGEQLRIRPTPERRYQDLTGDALPAGFDLIAETIRPGSRVFVAGAGTGLAGELVARVVGASGAVVTVERDGESVRYARKRYARPNVSVEFAGAEVLAGEISGSFDLTMALAPIGEALDGDQLEGKLDLLRVLRPGGRLIALGEDLREASSQNRIERFAWVWRRDDRRRRSGE